MISLTEAGQALGISRATAYRLADTGEFPVPVLTVGRSKKVSRRRLMAFIEGEQVAS